MISNYLCEKCGHKEVCKVMDIISKFDEDAKKPLGVNITIDQCSNFEKESDSEGNEE